MCGIFHQPPLPFNPEVLFSLGNSDELSSVPEDRRPFTDEGYSGEFRAPNRLNVGERGARKDVLSRLPGAELLKAAKKRPDHSEKQSALSSTCQNSEELHSLVVTYTHPFGIKV